MTDPMILSDAQQVIGRLWSEAPPQEQKRVLLLARDALDFISASGQWYPFQDFREGRGPRDSSTSLEEESPARSGLLAQTTHFFESLLGDPSTVDARAHIQTIVDALRFISATRQDKSLEEFIQRTESHAPPMVVASFETKEQADDWLKSHPSPPLFAEVLIGNSYHDVVYDRATNFRRLPRNRHFEWYLGWLERNDPPVASVSFATRDEAETWLKNQAHPPPRAWVLIAGEFYLAVFHPNVNHRALYPISMAIRDVL